MKQVLKVEGMMCNHCKERVEKVLSNIGVTDIEVSIENKQVIFDNNGLDINIIKETILDAGFDC